MAIEIKLPELGDGIESGDVIDVLVKEGDVIEKDQGIVELETDKATVEVPSTHAGKVTKVLVKTGQSVPIGAALIALETGAAAASKEPARQESPAESKPVEEESAQEAPPEEREEAPPQEEPPPQEEVAEEEDEQQQQARAPAKPAAKSASSPRKPVVRAAQAVRTAGGSEAHIPAGPAVRRFAREVGVDLAGLTGSGESGRITREDVLEVVRRGTASVKTPPGTESDAWGPIRTEKMSKVRKTIANKMHESWETAPRVTNFDDADITELEEFRQSSKGDYADRGIKLTTLPFVVKAVAMALRKHPVLNASLDMEGGQVIYKDYVNVGIAVDSERGLVVPSLRHADKLTIPEIAGDLAELAKKVRDGDYSIDDLRGGTFTVSNLGAIGGTYSTPIINVPEVAILLLGRSRKMPVVVGDKVEIRLMMPLSLSYDHRLVDGATAGRFLNEVIGYLKAPSRLLLAP
jgi:pyruvate/2-oxoglutarate dehydrogenase complex dihydrolipoamide acyltransferase (E2) component